MRNINESLCDRCGRKLQSPIISWFTTEVICMEKCWREEQEIKTNLPNRGRNHEGCGFIPELETIKI